MFGKNTFLTLSCAVLSLIFLSSCSNEPATTSTADSGAGSQQQSLVSNFLKPSVNDKPMVRLWFPDAGAGLDPDNTIAKQIHSLADAGFGGVEISMLADGADFNNEQAAIVGWGTPAWRNILKTILKEANKVPDGFLVDFTISPHWPLIINTIDPNDEAASQEIVATETSLSASMLANESFAITLPETKTFDHTTALKAAPFIFTDKLVSLSLFKKSDMSAPSETIYSLSSIVDLTNAVQENTDEGVPAGIPDQQTASRLGVEYKDVIAAWGEEPAADADLSDSFNSKIDQQGRRARMQDWQSTYAINTSLLREAIQDDDPEQFVVVATFRRGTGQVMSDGGFGGIAPMMHNRPYTTNYFDKRGIHAVSWFWDNQLLDDELRSLMANNKGNIFEDSIEAFSSSQFWSADIPSKLTKKNVSNPATYPAVIALGKDAFDNSVQTSQITSNFATILGQLYETEHLEEVKKWTHSFGYGYRAQARGVTGVDEFKAATIVDVPEGDNGTKGDGIRALSAAAHAVGNPYVSMEAVTGFGNLQLNWADVLTEVTQNFSDGINHVILHGSPYNKTWNGYTSDWPGWQAFGNNFAGTYSYRQIYWPDTSTLTNYIARNQAVIRNGKPQIDVLFVGQGEGNRYQDVLDSGYSYHVATESLFSLDTLEVKDNRLFPHAAAYKALIIDTNEIHSKADHIAPDGKSLGPEGVAKTLEFIEANAKKGVALHKHSLDSLLSLANTGLRIVLINFDNAKIDLSQEELDAYKASLFSHANVRSIDEQAQLIDIFKELKIQPESTFDKKQIESTLYVDRRSGSRIFNLYNNTHPANKGMLRVGQSQEYRSNETKTATVELKGTGSPYYLDAWTGQISPINSYTRTDNGIRFNMTLFGGESALIALLSHNDVSILDGLAKQPKETAESWRFNLKANDFITKTSLAENEWDLTLLSYSPTTKVENKEQPYIDGYSMAGNLLKDPSEHDITKVELGDVALGKWQKISLTDAQQKELGVKSMSEVSGIGVYKTTFDLNAVSDNTLLTFESLQDQVTSVSVNGIDFKNINVISKTLDITSALHSGENTIEIKLVTGLFNRALASGSSVFSANPRQINGKSPIDYGLVEVSLITP